MMRRSLLIVLTTLAAVAGLAGQVSAVGHYDLAWFRMWDKSEQGSKGGCGGIAAQLHVWVFDESGNRMGSVPIADQNGYVRWYTAGNGEQAKITELVTENLAVQIKDGVATSDMTPVVTSNVPPCWFHYVYEAGFVYKANASTPGDADDTIIGDLAQVGDTENDYGTPHTGSMVYTHQWVPPTYLGAPAWNLWGEGGIPDMPSEGDTHSQTFVATGVNRILGVFLFPVQPFWYGQAVPTRWRAEIHVGGPDGPTIYSKTTHDYLFFAQALAFDVDGCPVTPGETYTVTLDPLSTWVPELGGNSNVYLYPGTNNPNGQYYLDGVAYPYDMYGHVYGWDVGADTVGYIAGKVEDTNGDPLVDALVTLLDATGTTTIDTTQSDHTGSYAFKTATPGTYTVRVDLAGFDQGTQGGVVVTAGHYTIVNFTLSPQLQELTNDGFEMGNLHAWVHYGDGAAYVWPDPVGDVDTPGGTYYLGVTDVVSGGGVYQRARTLPGEDFQAAFIMKRQWGTAQARIGVDVDGGTDPAGVDYWSPWSVTHGAWSTDGDPDKKVSFTSTGDYSTIFLDVSASGDAGFACFDNVRLFRETGPNYSQERTFDTGWNLTSAPLLSDGAGDPVTTVFDEVIAAGNNLSGNLHRFDATSQVYKTYSGDFTNATQGTGYWMNLTAGTSETIAGPLPSDPFTQALGVGWNLLGQPHRYGTPISSLLFSGGGPVPGWHDHVQNGLMKYRSDGPFSGSWQYNALTAIEWRLYVVNNGYSSRYPRVKFREVAELYLSYDEREGWWELPGGNATVGGVNIAAQDRVLMSPNEWHTVRASHDTRQVPYKWSITIDGLTDSAHHAEGTFVNTGSYDNYVQWGVQSSGKYAEFYTNHVYWGQNEEIDNWPASKVYEASSGLAPEVPNGGYLGWGAEIENTTRHMSAVGVQTKTFAEAVEAGWVEGAAVGYDGGYEIVKDGGGDDTSLQAWYGYWLKVNQSGLSLKLPGPAETVDGGGGVVSRVKLALDADGCITSSFAAGLASGASDGYEATHDVTFPPAAPSGAKEVRLGTTLASDLMVSDLRSELTPGGTKVWTCTANPVNFSPSECKDVTITWDLSDSALYAYELVDLGPEPDVTTSLNPGGQYTFEVCQGEQLAFELRVGEGCSVVDYDGNGAVDEDDVNHFQDCSTGPGIAQTDPDCAADADLDDDSDVDQSDFGLLQECYTGPPAE